MKVLYHGTRYLNSILEDQCLRPRSVCGKQISLTTKKHVAKYWAEMKRDDVFGFGYILSLDWDLLQRDGFPLRLFERDLARFDVACSTTIEPIWRYVVKIERVRGSYSGLEDLARIRPAFVKARYKALLQVEERGWNYRRRIDPSTELTKSC